MSEKSYVTLEQHVCAICGKAFDTNALLLDRRLRDRFDMHTLTGYGICPEDQEKLDDGYIALVAAKDPPAGIDTIDFKNADRTGEMVWMRRSAFREVFTVPDIKDGRLLEMVFVSPDVINTLKGMVLPVPE